MKLTVLMENTACRPDCLAEHGLSLHIETGGKRILFDAGQSAVFSENAQMLGIRLADVDFAVLSHGHYDHGGGMLTFLNQNEKAPVYIRKEAFQTFLNSAGRDIGLDKALQKNSQVILTEESVSPAPGMTVLSCNERQGEYPIDSDHMHICRGDVRIYDDFRHEQYLLIEEAGKKILISGCSHKGILNIVSWFRPDVLVGGFHFMKQDPDGALVTGAAKKLLEYPTVYFTGHCTGLAQYKTMKDIMGDRLQYLAAGAVVEI